jgi:transcriptional regulator with XRE-family HTH domain
MGKPRRQPTRPKLVKAREKLGMTRPQLAAKMGRARSYIYKIEIGDKNPGIATIVDWLEALGPGATMELFAPHPALKQWSVVVRRTIARQLVA